MARYDEPALFRFSEAALETNLDRFYAMPKRLVHDGTTARLWTDGSSRSHPTASSILPVLALASWPENPADEWSKWGFLGHRRIAGLAGVNKASVRAALAHLEAIKLAKTRKVAPDPREGGPLRLEFCLHRSLFRAGNEPFFKLPASFIHGGVWSVLPFHGARHLLLVLGCLDAVHDEAALHSTIVAGCYDSDEEADERLERINAGAGVSYAGLCRYSGMSASGVIDALAALQVKFCGTPREGLITRGDARGGHFYRTSQRALAAYFPVADLNDRERRANIAAWWAHLLPKKKGKRRIVRPDRAAA